MIGSSIKTTNTITGEIFECSYNIYIIISQYVADYCSKISDEELDEIFDESNQSGFAKSFRLASSLEFYEASHTPKEILEIYKTLSFTDDATRGFLAIEEEENSDGSVRYVSEDNGLEFGTEIREIKIYYEEATEESLETWNGFIQYMRNAFAGIDCREKEPS